MFRACLRMQAPALDAHRVRTVVKPERLTPAAALEAGETGTHLGVLPVVSRTAQVPDGVLRHHLEHRPGPRSCPALCGVPPGTQHALGAPLPLIQTGLEVGERPVVGVPRIPRMTGKSHPVTGIDVKRNAMRTNHVFQANSSARLRHFTMFTCRPPKRATTVCIRPLCGRLRQIINHCGYPWASISGRAFPRRSTKESPPRWRTPRCLRPDPPNPNRQRTRSGRKAARLHHEPDL